MGRKKDSWENLLKKIINEKTASLSAETYRNTEQIPKHKPEVKAENTLGCVFIFFVFASYGIYHVSL